MNYFKTFTKERNLQQSTTQSYHQILKEYSKLNEQTINELIEEADKEEEQRIRSKKRKIKQRLLDYRQYMINNKLSANTIKLRMSRVKTFYRHFEIEIPYLPPTQLKKNFHERYDDIPTIKHVKEFIESSKNKKHKALVLFMSSSGTALNETINITMKDFIEGTKEYHNNDENIDEILYQLEKRDDIVPLIKMIRLKTNYPYYTCCSPEAANAIVRYLKFEDNLTLERKIFNYSRGGFLSIFNRFNDTMGWGKVGNQGFFHSHGLRKFHATAIEDIGLANTLQGRKSDPITEAYFKKNPNRIKEEYMKHLHKLSVTDVEVNIIDDEGTKKLRKVEKELADVKKTHKEEMDSFKENIKKEILADIRKEMLK
jgi:integrase